MKRTLILAILAFAVAGNLWADGTTPPAPTKLTAELVPSLVPAVVKLAWAAPEGPWGFKVYRSEADTLHFEPIGLVNARVFYDNLHFPQGNFFYYVTSFTMGPNSQFVESPRSNLAKMEFGGTPPKAKGIVAGTVKDDSTGRPIPFVVIRFSRMGSSITPLPPVSMLYALTDSLGRYKAVLDTGTYKVRAEPAPYMPPGPPAYIPEWFDNVAEMSAATPVPVVEGKTFTADFGLSRSKPPVWAHGTIAGKVIDDTTKKPLQGIIIRFTSKNDPWAKNLMPAVVTDEFGMYKAVLDTGLYLVHAEGPPTMSILPGYRAEWFDNAAEVANATPVLVTDGSLFVADFGLSRYVPPVLVTVEGTVKDTLGIPVRRASVVFMRTIQEMNATTARTGMFSGTGEESMEIDGVGHCMGVVWKGLTDSIGHYKATLLGGRSYIALASKWGYLPEYYNNKPNPILADIIVVTGNKTGIDFSLAVNPNLQNSISGIVLDSMGNGVPSRVVLIPVRPWWPFFNDLRFGHTDAKGSYTIGEVRTGKYFVLAVPFSGYAPAFYKAGVFGVIRWQKADTVTISGDVTGIDVGVVPIRSIGLAAVSGRVVTTNGDPLEGVRVMATTSRGDILGFGLTDNTGVYSMESVAPGVIDILLDRDGFQPAQHAVSISSTTYSVNTGDLIMTSVVTSADGRSLVPTSYQLYQNYPNPFNPGTTIPFTLPAAGVANLTVFSLLGQEVATLMNGPVTAGHHEVVWNAKDRLGRGVASGMYFYKLTVFGPAGAQEFSQIRKMLFVK